MAINYYCSIALQGSNLEFNKNQLIQPVMENSAAQPASPVEGQMYFDTTVGDKTMYFYNGAAWIEMDGTGSGVTSFTNANGTFISATTANTNATGAVTVGTIDLSASGTPNNGNFLRGDNVWATPAGQYTSWSLEGDVGSAINITDGLRVDFTGGTGINTTVASATPNTLTIDIANTAVTAGAYTNASITVDAQGRLTNAASGTAPLTNITAGAGLVETGAATTPTISVDYAGADNVIDGASSGTTIVGADKILYEDASDTTVKEIAVSSLIALAPNTQETYTLPVSAGGANSAAIDLTAAGTSTGIKSTVTFNGTTNEIEISEGVGNNGSITVGLPNSVVLATALTINGTGASALNIGSGKAQTAATTGSDPDATLTTKGYVDGLVSGGLTFKGTFNATTGAIVSGSNSGSNLYTCPSGAGTRVAVAVGDYYVVASGGSFYCSGVTLDIGDSIIATVARAANASVVGDWSVVQSDEGVVSFTNANGTYVSASTVNTNATGAVTMGTIDLSAVDGTSGTGTRFLSKDNTWDVPSYTTARAAGTGLSLAGNTINANVDGTNSVAANSSSTTAARTYKVQVDSSDNLVVNVPWSDTTGAVTSVDESITNNQKGIIVNPTTGAVKVGLDIIGQANLTGLADADDFLVYDASTTTNKRVGFDVIKAAIPNPTITLSGDVTGSGTTSISTTIAADAVEASMLNNNVISGQTAITTVVASDELLISDAGTIKRADVSQLADVIHAANGFAVTLNAFGNVTHNLNSFDVVVQLYDDTTKETVQACVDRTSVNVVAVSGSSFPAGNIRVLVSKVS
tara:strand:+ start:668 stop:3088 length:2421 start_codon:yes stop_codon:yes gene_type:complete